MRSTVQRFRAIGEKIGEVLLEQSLSFPGSEFTDWLSGKQLFVDVIPTRSCSRSAFGGLPPGFKILLEDSRALPDW